MKDVFLFFTLLITMFCSSCRGNTSQQEILSTISNPMTTTNHLIEALRALNNSGHTNEPTSFWTRIANSPKYTWDHRRRAVLQLFARHFHRGMTFAEVGRFLDHATWIDSNCISSSAAVNGPQPPNTEWTDALVYLSVGPCHPDLSVELLFVTKHDFIEDNDKLYECLTGKSTTPKLAHLQIDAVISGERTSGDELYNLWGIPSK